MSACPAPGNREDAELLAEIALGVRSVEAVFLPGLALRWISPSIEALTGFSAAECVAAADPFELLVFEDDRVFCRRMAQRVEAEGVAQAFELRLCARDGHAVWVQTHWRPRAGGGLRLSAEHIQARKATEFTLLETVAELRRQEALRELYLVRSNDERQRLAALLNLIRLGILFIDQDRRVLYHNRAMLEIWGYPPETVLVGCRDAVLKERAPVVLADPAALPRAHRSHRAWQAVDQRGARVPLRRRPHRHRPLGGGRRRGSRAAHRPAVDLRGRDRGAPHLDAAGGARRA
jgi:PAS domain-containing protein